MGNVRLTGAVWINSKMNTGNLDDVAHIYIYIKNSVNKESCGTSAKTAFEDEIVMANKIS